MGLLANYYNSSLLLALREYRPNYKWDELTGHFRNSLWEILHARYPSHRWKRNKLIGVNAGNTV